MESVLEIIESVPVPHLAEHDGKGAGGTQVVALAAGANASSHSRSGSAERARRAAGPSSQRSDCASIAPLSASDKSDPTCHSPRRKKKKDTRKGSEWLNSRRNKTRWSSKKRKKPRAGAWPVGPTPEPEFQCEEQVRRDELAWALQSIESEDEQPSTTASPAPATALSANSGSAARKKRKVDRHSSSPAEPASEEELELGSPLLPDADDYVEPPHPLRCGLRYDNMRRLHQHATIDTQRRIDPTSSSGSSQEGNHSERANDGGREYEGKVLEHRLRKYLLRSTSLDQWYECKEDDTVVTVCRKLKIPNVRVREVFECNRRRLADVPHFRQSTKLRKGHVLLVPDENAVLKTTVTAWDGWSKDGENWIETWTGRDQDGQQHDLEAEDIYTGTGFDVRGDTPGHQVIGQRVHGDSPLLVVAYMPAMDEGPMSGPALWKVHYEDKDGPTGERADLDQFELEEAFRASGVRLSISDGQPPPGQRDPRAVVTERSPSGGNVRERRRTSVAYQDPQLRAYLWQDRSTRSFMVVGKLRKLARRGGLPQSSSHDSSLAMQERCRCGCKAQQLDLKQIALESVDMAKLIDIEWHKKWFCGEICSSAPEVHRRTGRCGGRRNGHNKHTVEPECRKDKCNEDHDHSSQQMELEGSGVELLGAETRGLLNLQQENDPKHVLEVRTPADDYDTQGFDRDDDDTSVGEPVFQPVDESTPSEGCSDGGGALESGARGTPKHIERIEDVAERVPEVHTHADDYATQGCDLDDDDTSSGKPCFRPVDESRQSDVCSGSGGALESSAGGTPEHVDLADTNQNDSTDDEEEERRTYSQRRRVKTDAFDPFLESCKPQWSAAEKKCRTRDSAHDTGTSAVDSDDASPAGSVRSNIDVPSRSVSRNSDSMDESNGEPPEHVMLELFCGTCTVSQRAQVYWGKRVKRVTLDFNDKLHPKEDGHSDHHLVSDLLSITDVQKWVKSLLDKINKEWGARAISFVWASPDCSQYSTANTTKTYHEKDEGLLKADNLVKRTREIINELGAHAAKVHVPFQYIIENPSGGRLREREVIKDLPFFDVSYCHYGHPARKNTRLWYCAPGGFVERFGPRECSKDSAAGECEHKQKHGTHQYSATGGKGSQPGLQGPSRHKVPWKLVDELLAALFPSQDAEQLPARNQSLREQLVALRRQFTDTEITRELVSLQQASDEGSAASEGATAHRADTFVI